MNRLRKTVLSGVFIFFSVLGNAYAQQLEDKLIGVWEFKNNRYKNVKVLADTTAGIEFKDNGIVIFRTDISWCSQPVYKDFKGLWKLIDDSKLKITIRMSYPKGSVICSKMYRIKYLIKELTHDELILIKI